MLDTCIHYSSSARQMICMRHEALFSWEKNVTNLSSAGPLILNTLHDG